MPPLNHFKAQRRQICSLVVVLVAVGSLTVSLATRYSSPWDASSNSVRTIPTHVATDAKRQRLAKTGAIWMPPVFSFSALEVPNFYPIIAPVGPPVRSLVCDQNLYNRPPPALKSFSYFSGCRTYWSNPTECSRLWILSTKQLRNSELRLLHLGSRLWKNFVTWKKFVTTDRKTGIFLAVVL